MASTLRGLVTRSLPGDAPPMRAPRPLITPRVDSAPRRTRERTASPAVTGLLATLTGERPPHPADRSAWERRR